MKAKGIKAAILAPAFFVGIVPLLACGPLFAKSILNRGDAAVLVAPTVNFNDELKRLPQSLTPVRAVNSTNSYSEETLEAELGDLRAALGAAGKSSNDVERIVVKHAEQRIHLRKFVAPPSPEDLVTPEQTGEPPAKPSYSGIGVTDGLPGEFADYFHGAIEWNNPSGMDEIAMRESWEHLLKLPPEERRYKSTWAAYMLGRSWDEDDPKKAREYYQQVRLLAGQGFADTTGLAEASLGWEARLALQANEFETALDLYLQQYAAGGSSAANSLKFTLELIIAEGPKAYVPLATNPQQRKLMTAYLISLNPHDDTSNEIRTAIKTWLAAVEKLKVTDVESAEQFAVAAYQADELESTLHWVTRAGPTPVSQWITAKLLLRVGKTEKASAILSRIMGEFPMEEPTNNPTALSEGLYVRGYGRIYAGRQICGELGALKLAHRDYVQALDLFLRGDFWENAAYVADRVLTSDELRSYVDANWPVIAAASDENTSDEERKREALTVNIRYILARRLTRESRLADARPYFPTNQLAQADQLTAALTAGWDESLSAEQRALKLRDAAFIAQTNGMELMGTETAPDWTIYGGSSEGNWSVAKRTNGESALIASSTDEMKRNEESKPEPDKRYHYRFQAAELAWEAAKLMTNNTDATASLLCTAGTWLKYLDPKAADRFYKALVRRCRKTEIGAKADKLRWFPELDAEGNLRRSRFESMPLPSAHEIETGGAIAGYPTPGRHFIIAEGDRMSDVVAAVQKLGVKMTADDIYEANPEVSRWEFEKGRDIIIPLPGQTPVTVESSPDETPAVIEDPPPPPANSSDANDEMTYVIVKGDSIVTLARRLGVSIKQLLDANPEMNPSRLRIGQKIHIPSEPTVE